MTLSVIVPSIRQEGVIKLYNSIIDSFSGSWEMIVVGPNKIKSLSEKRNFWHEYSLRSPNACQQIGLTIATGDIITFAADDGEFLPGALDKAFELLDNDYKTIIVGKYLEGDNPDNAMTQDKYYRFGHHKAYRLKGVPQDQLIFNCGIISRKFMLELGGWDTSFEATTCAHADLGIRASQAGAKMTLMDKPLFKCSHQPGKTGDHKPIHEAMKRDLNTFKKLYSKPRQTVVDIDTWENTPIKWKERFK